MFTHLRQRWQDLFGARFDVLLYDLTSTYFECDPPGDETDKRRFGYSRDKRRDCVQVVIALIVTPEGFPLAYEVMPGNTADKTTLRDFLAEDRSAIRQGGTHLGDGPRHSHRGGAGGDARSPIRRSATWWARPRGGSSKLEKALLEPALAAGARRRVEVKLLPQDGELYVLAQSRARIDKERAMRRRQLKWLWARLKRTADHAPHPRRAAR